MRNQHVTAKAKSGPALSTSNPGAQRWLEWRCLRPKHGFLCTPRADTHKYLTADLTITPCAFNGRRRCSADGVQSRASLDATPPARRARFAAAGARNGRTIGRV